MPARDLVGLKGAYGEHRRFANDPTGGYGAEKWAAFLADIRKNGVTGTVDVRVWWTGDLAGDVKRMLAGKGTWSLPPLPGEALAPVEAFIYEGNHRVRAAAELGLEVPVQVTYYGHAERKLDFRKVRGRAARRSGLERTVAILVGDDDDEIRFCYRIEAAGEVLYGAYWCLTDDFEDDDAVPERPNEPALYISDIYIPSSRRGAGKARRMVQAAERWAYKQGARRCYLCATPYGDTNAVSFWRHLGYEVIESRWDSAVMVKDLPAHRAGKKYGRGRRNAVRRVAFDFDNTLTIESDEGYLGPNTAMIRTLRQHVARGDEVWIVTARSRRGLDRAMSKHYTTSQGFPLVHAFVRDQQLPVTNILFVGNIGKGPTLRKHGIALFYDDQEGQRQSAMSEGVEAHPPVYPS
jgi:GNAT superfamily N-acetyltransferase